MRSLLSHSTMMVLSSRVKAWLLCMSRDQLEVLWLACLVAWTWDQVRYCLMINLAQSY